MNRIAIINQLAKVVKTHLIELVKINQIGNSMEVNRSIKQKSEGIEIQ